MILFLEDLLKEIDILNWYRGEAVKNGDPDAVFVQSSKDAQEVMLYHIRNVVTDILLFANYNRVKFTCERNDDQLVFNIEPVREGREHLLELLKESIRQYIVYEVRRLWMATVRPEWADSSLRESLRENIRKAMNDSTTGNKVRRRYALMGI